MAQNRVALWAAEDLEEDVDLSLALGSYGQNDTYNDGQLDNPFCVLCSYVLLAPPQIDESAFLAMQQHMAQQAAFSQIPDVVKGVSNLGAFA